MATGIAVHDGQVLVVARSRVNLIVVSEIVHRCGLRTQQCESVESASLYLRSHRPLLIILDGGTHNRDCDALLDDIAALRPDGGPATPRVIMLSSRRGAAVNLPPSAPVDEVLAKQIIAEQLHSVIQRILRPTA